MYNKMKVLFLDNDSVICLYNNWGSRYKRQQTKWSKRKNIKVFKK